MTGLEMGPKDGTDPEGRGHGKLSYLLLRILEGLEVRKMPGFRRTTQ